MNLPLYLGGALVTVLLLGGAGYQGYRMGKDAEVAKRAREDEIRMETLHLANQAAAEAIAAQMVINQTTIQPVEKIIRENKVFIECVAPDELVGLLDAARAGRAPSIPVSDRVLPGTRADAP